MVRHERTSDDDRERLRLARMPRHYTDALVDRTVNAYTAMVDGTLKADRVDPTAPEGAVWERNTPQAIQAAIRRALIAPHALAVGCDTCGAEAGVYCFAVTRGLCGSRVHIAMTTIATLTNLEMSR